MTDKIDARFSSMETAMEEMRERMDIAANEVAALKEILNAGGKLSESELAWIKRHAG